METSGLLNILILDDYNNPQYSSFGNGKAYPMLEIRPNCEHCNKDLPNTSSDAMICSFECTYCKECAIDLFENVCPSCSGNFVPRPIRPQKEINVYPASAQRVIKPKNLSEARINSERFKDILPTNR